MDRDPSTNDMAADQEDAEESRLHSLQQSWELLGDEDPLWAILSVPEKKGGGWNVDEFFNTGEQEVSDLFEFLSLLSTTPDSTRALDFGCGVGRVTRALARRFDRVVGVDVSSTMIAKARSINAEISNIEFIHVPSVTLPVENRSVSFIYSRLVLQHMQTELAVGYLGEFVRGLAPGGIAVFQAPSEPRISGEIPPSPVQLEQGTVYIEMHSHPRRLVEATVESAGGRIIHVSEDDCAGPAFQSLRYVVTV